jgi:hypothetical protein
LYGNSASKLARLPKAADGKYLQMISGFPAWGDPPGGTAHNLLSTTHLDTLPAAVARGDLLIGNSTPAWSRLPIGAANRVLKSDGTDVSWGQVSHTELTDVLPDQHHAQLHKDSHKTGGSDAFTVSDLLDAIARVTVRKNTGANIGSRRRLNFIEGSNITLTIADDAVDEEIDVTIASGGGVPSDTVVSETSFDQTANAGTSTTYSRGDHTHGTPPDPHAMMWALILG